MSYSYYLPAEDHTYRYNAVSRRPVSPGFTERTTHLLNKTNNISSINNYKSNEFLNTRQPYHLSQRYTRDASPFQTADYIPTRNFNDAAVRRSGHLYMSTNSRSNGYLDDYDSQPDNKVYTFKYLKLTFFVYFEQIIDSKKLCNIHLLTYQLKKNN